MPTKATDIKTQLSDGSVCLEDSPSPPKLLHEHSKTVIALATAFFGVSVSLADRQLGQAPEWWQFVLLFGGWILLVCSVVAAIVIVVQLNSVLSGDTNQSAWDLAKGASTLSYVLLVIAALALGGLSASQAIRKNADLDAAASVKRAAALASSTDPAIRWTVQSLVWKDSSHNYDIKLVTEPLDSTKSLCITVHSKSGRIESYRHC